LFEKRQLIAAYTVQCIPDDKCVRRSDSQAEQNPGHSIHFSRILFDIQHKVSLNDLKVEYQRSRFDSLFDCRNR